MLGQEMRSLESIVRHSAVHELGQDMFERSELRCSGSCSAHSVTVSWPDKLGARLSEFQFAVPCTSACTSLHNNTLSTVAAASPVLRSELLKGKETC